MGGYRVVLRDRAFLHLTLTNIAIIAVGWGVFTWLAPPYAQNQLHLSTQLIGLLLLANTATVVIAQAPIARLAEGRRRVVLIALAAVLFTGACLLVIAAGGSSDRGISRVTGGMGCRWPRRMLSYDGAHAPCC
jgi:MFS family permease